MSYRQSIPYEDDAFWGNTMEKRLVLKKKSFPLNLFFSNSFPGIQIYAYVCSFIFVFRHQLSILISAKVNIGTHLKIFMSVLKIFIKKHRIRKKEMENYSLL